MSTELPANHYSTEDEISFLDLTRVLLKRKLLLLSVFVVGSLLVVVAALFHQQQYLYSISIEVGTLTDEHGREEPVESPNTVEIRLNEGIIPTVMSDYESKNPGRKAPSFNVRLPRKSDFLILEGKGLPSDVGDIVDLENAILARLKEDQAALYEMKKTDIVNALVDKDSQLEDEKALQQSLHAAQKRNAKLMEVRVGQLKGTRQRLDRLVANRAKLGQGQSSILDRLLIDSEIEKAQRMVLELEQDVNLDLPAMRDELDRNLAASIRSQALIEAEIAKTRLQLENIQETRFISEPGLNPTPTGVTKKAIIAVGILLSTLLAVMSVFVAEFISRARLELASRDAG